MFFADTFYWIALTNPRDIAHGQVIQFTAGLARHSVMTADEVLTEFLAFCSSNQRLRRQGGFQWSDLLIDDPDIRVVPHSRGTVLAGLML